MQDEKCMLFDWEKLETGTYLGSCIRVETYEPTNRS